MRAKAEPVVVDAALSPDPTARRHRRHAAAGGALADGVATPAASSDGTAAGLAGRARHLSRPVRRHRTSCAKLIDSGATPEAVVASFARATRRRGDAYARAMSDLLYT